MNKKCLIQAIAWWVVLAMGMPLIGLLFYDLRDPVGAYWSIFVNTGYIVMMVVLLAWLVYVHISAQQKGESK